MSIDHELRALTKPIIAAYRKMPGLIVDMSLVLGHVFMAVGWTANLVKIFLTVDFAERIWRLLAAIIFPIGSIYGYL